MINLVIDGKLIGVFSSVFACWKPLDAAYNALSEKYDTPINWKLVRCSDGAFIDGRGEYEGEFQHPEGLPAGLWFALAENAEAFNIYFKNMVGWSSD